MPATQTRRSITIHFISDFIGEGLKNNRYLTSRRIPNYSSRDLIFIFYKSAGRIQNKNEWSGKEARPAEEGTGLQTEAGWTGYTGTEGPDGLGGVGRDRMDESGEEGDGALDLHTCVFCWFGSLGLDGLKNMLVVEEEEVATATSVATRQNARRRFRRPDS